MKATSRYIKVHYEDKVVFTERRRAKHARNVAEVWRQSQGIWKDHPIFHDMAVKEIIEWLRGEDSDV